MYVCMRVHEEREKKEEQLSDLGRKDGSGIASEKEQKNDVDIHAFGGRKEDLNPKQDKNTPLSWLQTSSIIKKIFPFAPQVQP